MLELQNYGKTRGHQMKQKTLLLSSRVAPDWNGLPENAVLETSIN